LTLKPSPGFTVVKNKRACHKPLRRGGLADFSAAV
jgi:hypothetical protein